MEEDTTMGAVPRRTLLAAPMLLAADRASAQQGWPTRPLRVINPWPPGGPADIICRPLTQKLSDSLGQTVVMENRPGANGTIGANLVARAAPDGYTLFFSHVGPVSISPVFATNLPYDPLRDFAPITQLVSGPIVLVCRPDVPATSVAELVALAKARPGTITYGSVGPASTTHLAGEMIALMAGVQLVHVPYPGSTPVVNDMLGGRIDFAFINISGVLPLMEAGRLRSLAVSTLRRSPKLPDLPAVAETLPGFEVNSWYGMIAPAGTPPALVDRLHRECAAAVRAPEMTRHLEDSGFTVEATTPDQYAQKIRDDIRRWTELQRATGIRIQ
jgi:tripartite-type tricarboxylate transporter receptor subunit TctC